MWKRLGSESGLLSFLLIFYLWLRLFDLLSHKSIANVIIKLQRSLAVYSIKRIYFCAPTFTLTEKLLTMMQYLIERDVSSHFNLENLGIAQHLGRCHQPLLQLRAKLKMNYPRKLVFIKTAPNTHSSCSDTKSSTITIPLC